MQLDSALHLSVNGCCCGNVGDRKPTLLGQALCQSTFTRSGTPKDQFIHIQKPDWMLKSTNYPGSA